jgi:hypothetical protein
MAFGPIIVVFRNSTFLSLDINWFVNVYMVFFLSNFRLIEIKQKSTVCYCATNYTIIKMDARSICKAVFYNTNKSRITARFMPLT